MLADMKEQMKKRQDRSDRDREHAALGRENVIREQEALKKLNDQFQTQIVALQDTQAQTMDEPGVGETQSDRPIMNTRQRRLASPLYENSSDDEANSPRYQVGVQRDQTHRKIE